MNRLKLLLVAVSLLYTFFAFGFLNGSLNESFRYQSEMQKDLASMVASTESFVEQTKGLASVPPKLQQIHHLSESMLDAISLTNEGFDHALKLQMEGLTGLKKLDREIEKLNKNLAPLPAHFQKIQANLNQTVKTTDETRELLSSLHRHLKQANSFLSEIEETIP